MDNIRNFVIIAHIDSGKSTLADRLLEITHTVEMRQMMPQYLDKLDLERERGITIKMAPVRMKHSVDGKEYILNLIDTPGHSDFSYEVSRALHAVEGAILLVDATKGIQAQTLSNLRSAQKAGLKIIGAVNKVDLQLPQVEKVVEATANLLGVNPEEIFRISAKTGLGVEKLLEAAVRKFPGPKPAPQKNAAQALIFDSLYDDHKGILAFVRVFGGEFKAGDDVHLVATNTKFKIKEVGFFNPELKAGEKIPEGMIGYIATGLKEPAKVSIGDTIAKSPNVKVSHEELRLLALHGYRSPSPVVFISFYPDGRTKFEDLKDALERLRLNDAALSIEPEANEALGRGLKVGFLGQLHFDITASRLTREFNLEFLTSFPSIAFRITDGGREYIVNQPQDFPDKPEKVLQPMIDVEILTPSQYLNPVVNLKNTFDLQVNEIINMGENLLIVGVMPLYELIRDFDDQLKSVSSGFASFSYEFGPEAEAHVVRLEILLAGEVVPALTRIVTEKDLEYEARKTVERLKDLLPREQFALAIQAQANGRIVARETLPALKKNLGDFGKNGGDRTRKMKLWRKQKRGKERLKEMARVDLSPEIFREILKK